MTDSFIQLPSDSTGKKLRTAEATVGANVVQTQYVRIEAQGGPDSVQFIGTATNRATNEWTSLQSLVVPAGFVAQPISFRGLSATAGYGARAIFMRKLGEINLSTGTYTDTGVNASVGSFFTGLTAVIPATLTTAAQSLSISFTDEQGVARTATLALALNQPVASRIDAVFPTRTDTFGRVTPVAGVFDVTNVTRPTSATGIVHIYGYDTISYLRMVAANTVYVEDVDPHLFSLRAGDILSVESNSYGTAVAAIVQERQLLFQMTAV